jgi:hypothetical protein
MMEKLGLNYRLEVGTTDGDTIIIEPPFTVQFNVIRNTNSKVNACQMRIYNLSPKNRDRLRFNISNWGKPLPMQFLAGYGDKLARIFRGNISFAWTVRERVDYITQIEAFDGGLAYVNSVTNQNFPAGTPFREVIRGVTGDLEGVSTGAIGAYEGTLRRPNVYFGSTMHILRDLTGGGTFIDDGKAHSLFSNEYIQTGNILVVSPVTGLLNTPVYEQSIVRFEMLFEPQLNVGVRVQLEAGSDKSYNGLYKVTSVAHAGIISESVASSVISKATFFYTKFLTGVNPIL